MPTAKEFEARIRANPENDEDYLVYGDWLQEQGHPRAYLIALQRANSLAPNNKRLRGELASVLPGQCK